MSLPRRYAPYFDQTEGAKIHLCSRVRLAYGLAPSASLVTQMRITLEGMTFDNRLSISSKPFYVTSCSQSTQVAWLAPQQPFPASALTAKSAPAVTTLNTTRMTRARFDRRYKARPNLGEQILQMIPPCSPLKSLRRWVRSRSGKRRRMTPEHDHDNNDHQTSTSGDWCKISALEGSGLAEMSGPFDP